MSDMVNNPSHYQLDDGVEAIDIIQSVLIPAEFRASLKANVYKYLLREPFKGNPVQDVDKALWYLKRYREELAKVEAS